MAISAFVKNGSYVYKQQLHFYWVNNAGQVNTNYTVHLNPTQLDISYIDEESTKGSSKEYTEKWKEKKKLKKGQKYKGKKLKKNKTIKEKKSKTHKVNGTATKSYLTGYYTEITFTIGCLTDKELSGLILCLKGYYHENIKQKGTYTNHNGNTVTKTWDLGKKVVDRVRVGFFDPYAQCACQTFFKVGNIDFSTSFKKDGKLYYEDVEITLRSCYKRKPRSKFEPIKGSYLWIHSTKRKVNGTKGNAPVDKHYWETNKRPEKWNSTKGQWVSDVGGSWYK